MMIADAPTPSANTVWFVILALGTLAGNLAMVGQYFALRRRQETTISPQPFLVAMEKEFATKRELELHVQDNKKEIDGLHSKIGGVERGAARSLGEQIQAMRSENREDVNLLHEKINETRESVAALSSKTDLQNQTLAQIGSKLDRIIENKLK